MPASNKPVRLAVDVGGTFTDLVLDGAEGLVTCKIATDIDNPEQGILEGMQILLQKAGISAGEVSSIIHGTTLATNALIERKGARTALITTEGFRDSLEIGYENRYDQYDLAIQKPRSLVPRYLRYTVFERCNARGEVLRRFDPESLQRIIPQLRQQKIEAVAIGLLHSYANPDHEHSIAAMLREQGITAEISMSSEVCPEVREYERLTTTVCNAYVQPLMARYLRALQSELSGRGFVCPLFLMTSGGGMTNLEAAIRFPVRLVESGPSGGAVLASGIAAQTRQRRVLSYDMGGTTAKICLIDDYRAKIARDFEIARSARFHKGSGMPVRIPVVEMIEIGAGGGSVAHIDSLGRLAIGPHSAGASPGPACYDKGGSQACVTDADLLLGKIDPLAFAEGRMPLQLALAETALGNGVGKPLGIGLLPAAAGVTEMVEENMANAARIHSVEHGANLSEYTMIAFGGAGPLHAIRLAQKLNIGRVIVPNHSSVGSALGFLWAPISYELLRSRYMTTQSFDAAAANNLLESLTEQARSVVRAGAPEGELQVKRSAYMRYAGQGHEIEVSLPVQQLLNTDSRVIQSSYEDHYQKLFGRCIPQRDIEILSWAVVVSSGDRIAEGGKEELETATLTSESTRRCYCPQQDALIDYAVYQREQLSAGNRFDGPALVVEAQTSSYICGGWQTRVDSRLNLVIERLPA